MESFEKQSRKRKRMTNNSKMKESSGNKRKKNQWQDVYTELSRESKDKNLLDKRSTRRKTIHNLNTDIISDDEKTDEENSKILGKNSNTFGKPEISPSTIQYITKVSDDEEIDVVSVDENPKSLDTTLKHATPIAQETDNKTIKPVLSLAEGIQKLFSPTSKRFNNSLVDKKIIHDIDKLKTIENKLDDGVKIDINVNILDNTFNQNNCIPMIDIKNNNELEKRNKGNLIKAITDEEFFKLNNVKVTLDSNVVKNYFKSKQSSNENTISDLNKTDIVTTPTLNHKKTLKQTTMLHFFNTKSIKAKITATDNIENNEHSLNTLTDNRATVKKEDRSKSCKTSIASSNRLIYKMQNSNINLLFDSSLKVAEISDSDISKSTVFSYCNDCDYKTNKGKVRILQHIQNKHANGFINGIAKCQQCDKTFKKNYHLKSHQAICGLIPHFKCPFCFLRSKYDSNIKKHLLKQHQNEFETNEFDDIFHKIISEGKAFKVKAMKSALEGKEIPKMVQEKKTTMKNKIDMYCIDCNEAFVRNSKENRMKTCPNCDNVLRFQCVKCKKVLKSYEGCWAHITHLCEPQERKILQCNDCSFTSFVKSKLAEHILRKHTEIDPKDYVKCPYCNKGFKTKDYMMYHKHNVCGSLKDYVCQFCSYKTNNIYQWNKHMKMHKLHSKDKSPVSNLNNVDSAINKSSEINDSSSKSEIHSDSNYKKVEVVIPNIINADDLRQRTLNTLNLAVHICLKCKAVDSSTSVKQIICNKCQVQMHYSCKLCNRTYVYWGSFCQHLIQKCATPDNYQCEHCDRQFTIKDNLRRHIFAEHMIEIDSSGFVKCPKCKNKYKGRQNMLKHKIRCGLTKQLLKCKFCNIKSNYKHNLRKHMLNKHFNLSRMEVDDALNEIVKKAKMKKGVTKKNKIPKIKSNTVSNEIKNNLNLTPMNQNGVQVISLKMNKKEKIDTMHLIQVKCLACSKSYTADKKKKDHHFTFCFYCKKDNIFKCMQCSKEYSRTNRIRKHIKLEHLLESDYQRLLHECKNCGKRFTFYEHLKIHWRLCLQTERFICDYCGFTTKHKNSLINHIKRKHLGIKIKKDHECVKCGFKFLEKEQLQKHIRNCLGGYKCDECGAKFKEKHRLIHHIQSKKIN